MVHAHLVGEPSLAVPVEDAGKVVALAHPRGVGKLVVVVTRGPEPPWRSVASELEDGRFWERHTLLQVLDLNLEKSDVIESGKKRAK